MNAMKPPGTIRRLFAETFEDAILALLLATAIVLATTGVRSCYAHAGDASSHTAAHELTGHHA